MTAKIKSRPTQNYKNRPKGVSVHQFEKTHWPFLPLLSLAIVGAIFICIIEFGATGVVIALATVAVAALVVLL